MSNRSGWNPTRRNRNIGTAKQGYGQSNKMEIPSRWTEERIYYEVLSPDTVVREYALNGNTFQIFVEPTRKNCFHHCTVDDIKQVLGLIPSTDWSGIQNIILRQPTKKQESINPVWGRLSYWSKLGKHCGPSIFLEAQPSNMTMKWSKSLDPDDSKELERLIQDGHAVDSGGKKFVISCSPESIRFTQLYRTLLHEVGHEVDYCTSVDSVPESERSNAEEAYNSKPRQEREAFAHRYADEISARLFEEGTFPFKQIYNEEALSDAGLDSMWFKKEG